MIIDLLQRLQSAIDRWLEWVAVDTVAADGHISRVYASPTQAMVSRIIGATLVASAVALQFLPDQNPKVVHQIDELMRAAARL